METQAKKSDLAKMYALMLSKDATRILPLLKAAVCIRNRLNIPRSNKPNGPENMVSRFLRKELGVSAYGDLMTELGTRICNNSQHEIVQAANLHMPECRYMRYDAVKNIVTLDKGTTINLNTGYVKSGVEKYMEHMMLDVEMCQIIKSICIERLVRDEAKLRNKCKSKRKKRTLVEIDSAFLFDDVIVNGLVKTK